MNSTLYRCTVMHHRLTPVRHRFVYRLFMFCLDLDELDELHRRLLLFRRNGGNIFTFRDDDHLRYGEGTVRERILRYIRSEGYDRPIARIMLLTHLRTFGYVFNPVSFYFCYGDAGEPLCAVVEVGNTFGEMKPYFIRGDQVGEGRLHRQTEKYFYVSPFVDLDAVFDFHIGFPGSTLNIIINDIQHGERFLLTSLSGTRESLSNARLLWYAIRFPFITLQVIGFIHWQAFRLYLKKLPFHRKSSDLHLQQNVFHGKSS